MADDNDKKGRFWAFSIVALLLIISIWYYAVDPVYVYIVAYMWFGFSYGVLQQWGRFCFASAWRDLIGLRVTRMFVGIMVALAVFGFLMAILEVVNLSTFHAAPLGAHELYGGIIFGLGMVLAGGCATGTLYKTGEGNMTSAVALFGIIFSQAIFVDIGSTGTVGTGYFDRFLTGTVFPQPQYQLHNYFASYGNLSYFMGNWLVNGVLVTAILFALVYWVVVRKDNLAALVREGKSTSMSIGDHISGFTEMITASKRTSIAGILIGLLAALNVLVIQALRDRMTYGGESIDNFGRVLQHHLGKEVPEVGARGTVFDPGYWYITSQEAQFGAWFIELFGVNMHDNMFFGVINAIPHPLQNPLLWMSIGLILGATVMAKLSGEFKFKIPDKGMLLTGLVGGTLMGIGARLALGCNIGGFFIRAAGGDPGGWVFFAGMGIGAFVSVKYMQWRTDKAMEDIDFDIEI
jgi:uncharacterized membrane protein YedE/YeeE